MGRSAPSALTTRLIVFASITATTSFPWDRDLQHSLALVSVKHDMRRKAPHIGIVKQAIIAESFVCDEVWNDDYEHVVDGTRNAVALLDFATRVHLLSEGQCGPGGLVDEIDLHDCSDAKAELCAIELGGLGQDDASLSKSLQASLHGSCRQTDLDTDLLTGYACVALVEI